MKKQFVGLILVLLLTVPFSAYAGPPLDTVKGHIDKVLDVLRDRRNRFVSCKEN